MTVMDENHDRSISPILPVNGLTRENCSLGIILWNIEVLALTVQTLLEKWHNYKMTDETKTKSSISLKKWKFSMHKNKFLTIYFLHSMNLNNRRLLSVCGHLWQKIRSVGRVKYTKYMKLTRGPWARSLTEKPVQINKYIFVQSYDFKITLT